MILPAKNTPVAMGIAGFKAFIVAAIFMHLKYSARINWAFAVSGIVFLLIMIVFVASDITGRHWQYQPSSWEKTAVPAASIPAAHLPE